MDFDHLWSAEMLRNWLKVFALPLLMALGLSSQSSAQSITVRLGFSDPVTTPWGQSLTEFKRIVESESKNRIQVQLYPSEQLGSLVEMIENVRQGAQEMSCASPSWLAQFYPKIELLELPFLVTTWDEAWRLLDSKPYHDLLAAADKAANLHVYATFPFGFRIIANNKHSIAGIEDLKGLKLRVINSPTQIAVWRALGANPVGMNWSEVYNAAQTGVIDGVENTPGVLAANKFPEVTKYVSVSRHMFGIMLCYINPKFYAGLSSDDHALLDRAMHAAEDFNRKNVIALEEQAEKDLKSQGGVINQVSPEAFAKMRSAVQPVYGSVSAKFDPELAELRKVIQQ
jgi:TRAP-type transport system periplasmic protein